MHSRPAFRVTYPSTSQRPEMLRRRIQGSCDIENDGKGPDAWTTTNQASYSLPDSKRQLRSDAELVVFEPQESSRFAGTCIKPAPSVQNTRPSSARLRRGDTVENENSGRGPSEWSTTANASYSRPATAASSRAEYYGSPRGRELATSSGFRKQAVATQVAATMKQTKRPQSAHTRSSAWLNSPHRSKGTLEFENNGQGPSEWSTTNEGFDTKRDSSLNAKAAGSEHTNVVYSSTDGCPNYRLDTANNFRGSNYKSYNQFTNRTYQRFSDSLAGQSSPKQNYYVPRH